MNKMKIDLHLQGKVILQIQNSKVKPPRSEFRKFNKISDSLKSKWVHFKERESWRTTQKS